MQDEIRERASQLADDLFSGAGNQLSRLWIAGAVVVFLVVGLRSCTTLEPGQVAVRVNNFTGSQTTLTRPGLVMRLPFGVHSVHIIDASPQTFTMKGNQNVDQLNVQELTVRASDGSNFVFKDTTVIFRVLGDRAQDVIRDSGRSSGFRGWMRPLTRAILREEFGRESTISVSNPASFGEATERARTRLNDALSKHGIEVSKIVTPRPRFNEKYENLIESRNEAENQLTVIQSELDRAATDRQRRLAEVDRESEQDHPGKTRRIRDHAGHRRHRAGADQAGGRHPAHRKSRHRPRPRSAPPSASRKSCAVSSTPSIWLARPRSTRSGASRSNASWSAWAKGSRE